MQFSQARNVIIPTGKYAGQTIDQAAATDVGLIALDVLRTERRRYKDELYEALVVYLDDPTIAKDLKQATKRDSRPLRAVRGEGLEWL